MSARRRTAAVVLLALVALLQTGQTTASAGPVPTRVAGPGHCC
jgi:hypothetical protein